MLRRILLLAALALMATGMGLYVYPTRPTLVWALLGLCWGCYRLSLRARARFAKREEREPSRNPAASRLS